VLFVLGLWLGVSGCKEERPEPTDPEGAFRLFQEAIAERDEDGLWQYLDVTTKELFYEQYVALVRIDRIIETYFDPSEHRYMRRRTGAYLLQQEQITSPEALYRFLFDIEAIAYDRDHEVGASVDKLTYDESDPTIATIVTRGGQTFLMVQEDDGHWRTPSLRNFFEEALAPIALSEEAMKEFAKENLLGEIERRKQVIEYFQRQVHRQQKR